MKKIYTLFITLILICAPLRAQQTEVRNIMERYKGIHTLTAAVTQTQHSAAVAADRTARGHFYFKQPARMCITLDEGREILLKDGNIFTRVADGKKSVARGRGANPFETIQIVIETLTSDTAPDNALAEVADVKMTRNGNLCVFTITPTASDAKSRRRMMFTSFVLTVDLHSRELRSMLLNGKGENYTQYDFSDYAFDAAVSDSVFNLPS